MIESKRMEINKMSISNLHVKSFSVNGKPAVSSLVLNEKGERVYDFGAFMNYLFSVEMLNRTKNEKLLRLALGLLFITLALNGVQGYSMLAIIPLYFSIFNRLFLQEIHRGTEGLAQKRGARCGYPLSYSE